MTSYKFNFIEEDTYELEYKNRKGEEVKLPFKRDIKLARDLQRIQAKARRIMIKDLLADGETRDDYIIKNVNKDGTITYDETPLREVEQTYIQIVCGQVLMDIIEDMFNKDADSLFEDMGIDPNSQSEDNMKAIEMFTTKFTSILSGKDKKTTPSGTNKE